MELDISIDGETYRAQAFRALSGIVLFAPQIAGLDAPPFDLFFQDVLCRQKAFKVLEQAEVNLGVIEMARDEASVDHWPLPVTVEDYLFWIEEEAFIQSHYGWYFTDDPDGPSYAEELQRVADELRTLGFKPSRAPWQKEDPLDIPLAPE